MAVSDGGAGCDRLRPTARERLCRVVGSRKGILEGARSVVRFGDLDDPRGCTPKASVGADQGSSRATAKAT